MNIIRKLTRAQFLEFVDHYYHDLAEHQRLGQAFCNTFNITDPSVFYDVDEESVLDHIEANYVVPHDDPHQLAA